MCITAWELTNKFLFFLEGVPVCFSPDLEHFVHKKQKLDYLFVGHEKSVNFTSNFT